MAAVVLRQDASVTEKELRQFVAARLALFKVPRRVFMVEEVPKGPTGKLRRLGMAEHIALIDPGLTQPDRDTHATAPRTQAEELLARLWAQVIGVECVGIHDDFFALGGDSLMATQLISLIRDATQVEVSFLSFFDTPTVAEMARCIEETSQAVPDPQAVPLSLCPGAARSQRLMPSNACGSSGNWGSAAMPTISSKCCCCAVPCRQQPWRKASGKCQAP